MYEDNKSPIRRIILIVLAAVAIVAVIWLVVWLLFLRGNSTKKVSTPAKPATSTSQPATDKPKPTPPPPTSTDQGATQPSPAATAPATTPPTTKSANLANTGPGDVFAVAGLTAVAGSIFYYSRTRRRLLQ